VQIARNEDKEALTQIKNSKRDKKKQEVEDISSCLKLVIEYGAGKSSDEYFMSTKLFRDKHNRTIFSQVGTIEERLLWLQQWCREKSG
jgi:predicted RNA-binding protein